MKMKYGKLNGEKLTIAPNPLVAEGRHIFTNDPKIYAQHGWLPVVYTAPPECPEGYTLSSHWQEQGGQIVRVWEVSLVESGEVE